MARRGRGQTDMDRDASATQWRDLLDWTWLPTLAILMSGVLLQSMNSLLLTTVLPSIAAELGGAGMLSLPATAYVGASIVAASGAGLLTTRYGVRDTLCVGVVIFGLGALVCSFAASMEWVIAARLVQGFGGGLEVGAAYTAVRAIFPPRLWPRVIALMATSWTISVFAGPLVGGLFARAGHWRGALIVTVILSAILAVAAALVLPANRSAERTSASRLPAGRIGLICLAITAMSAASLVQAASAKAGLILVAVAALALMLRFDRGAPVRLLPSDAFSFRTETGIGLWLILLLCIAFSPLHIYLPVFLQRLRGLDPLEAGFMVASGSLAWTIASVLVSGLTGPWPRRLLLSGPVLMAGGLIALGLLLQSPAPSYALIPAVVVLGIGIGQAWPFVGPTIMNGAKPGDEAAAASAVPTIQQTGLALGAALAGVVANASGFASAVTDAEIGNAAFWVPACFAIAAGLAWLASVRLYRQRRASPGSGAGT